MYGKRIGTIFKVILKNNATTIFKFNVHKCLRA